MTQALQHTSNLISPHAHVSCSTGKRRSCNLHVEEEQRQQDTHDERHGQRGVPRGDALRLEDGLVPGRRALQVLLVQRLRGRVSQVGPVRSEIYATPRRNTSHHITYITIHHMTIHHTTPHYNTSHDMTWHHITSRHITSHHVTSHHITSQYITSHHITPHHTTSHDITPHQASLTSLRS
jgi:hypothetical protein